MERHWSTTSTRAVHTLLASTVIASKRVSKGVRYYLDFDGLLGCFEVAVGTAPLQALEILLCARTHNTIVVHTQPHSTTPFNILRSDQATSSAVHSQTQSTNVQQQEHTRNNQVCGEGVTVGGEMMWQGDCGPWGDSASTSCRQLTLSHTHALAHIGRSQGKAAACCSQAINMMLSDKGG